LACRHDARQSHAAQFASLSAPYFGRGDSMITPYAVLRQRRVNDYAVCGDLRFGQAFRVTAFARRTPRTASRSRSICSTSKLRFRSSRFAVKNKRHRPHAYVYSKAVTRIECPNRRSEKPQAPSDNWRDDQQGAARTKYAQKNCSRTIA
jgi:hypothetical protein